MTKLINEIVQIVELIVLLLRSDRKIEDFIDQY